MSFKIFMADNSHKDRFPENHPTRNLDIRNHTSPADFARQKLFRKLFKSWAIIGRPEFQPAATLNLTKPETQPFKCLRCLPWAKGGKTDGRDNLLQQLTVLMRRI